MGRCDSPYIDDKAKCRADAAARKKRKKKADPPIVAQPPRPKGGIATLPQRLRDRNKRMLRY